MSDREALEAEALKTCSALNTYDLRDCISDLTDDQLRQIIACQGDYEKELALSEGK